MRVAVVKLKELQPLTDEQVKAFLQAAELDPLGSLLIVILFTGLRESKAIGLKRDCIDFRVHDLRHTFAVLSLQNGDDIKTAQGNLGHSAAAFTLDVYGHVSERMKDNSAARTQAYIAKTAE